MIKRELTFIKRLLILSVIAVTGGYVTGAMHTIEQLQKRNTAAERPQRLQEIAKNRVFRVYVQSMFGMGGGTAFLARTKSGKNIVLTNKHICEASERGYITFLEQDGKRYFTEPLLKSTKTDLCLLRLPLDLANDPAYSIAAVKPEKEETVFVFGHPFLEKLTENHGQYRHDFVLPVVDGEKYKLDGLNAGRLSFFIRPGNSGSPVVNIKNEIVGVVFAVDDLGGLVIPLVNINEFLDSEASS